MASINRGDYCVSKAGLAMAARLFAVRLAGTGSRSTKSGPGIIETDMTAGVREAYDQRIADGLVPERRWGTPEDVGRIVAALLRGDAPYATGQRDQRRRRVVGAAPVSRTFRSGVEDVMQALALLLVALRHRPPAGHGQAHERARLCLHRDVGRADRNPRRNRGGSTPCVT